MEEAVARAASAREPGDAVVLSPACARYDMFHDYEHRGRVFRAAVEALCDEERIDDATATTTSLKPPIDEPLPGASADRARARRSSLFAAVLALVGFGIVMVYSASARLRDAEVRHRRPTSSSAICL